MLKKRIVAVLPELMKVASVLSVGSVKAIDEWRQCRSDRGKYVWVRGVEGKKSVEKRNLFILSPAGRSGRSTGSLLPHTTCRRRAFTRQDWPESPRSSAVTVGPRLNVGVGWPTNDKGPQIKIHTWPKDEQIRM